MRSRPPRMRAGTSVVPSLEPDPEAHHACRTHFPRFGLERYPGRVRNREDVPIDGAIPSFDARRPSPPDGARRRDRDEGRPRRRLPAPRRREDRREHDLQPVRAVHGPAGLPGPACEQHGVLDRCREARKARGAPQVPGHSRDHRGDGPHLRAPDGTRRIWHRCRRLDRFPLLIH